MTKKHILLTGLVALCSLSAWGGEIVIKPTDTSVMIGQHNYTVCEGGTVATPYALATTKNNTNLNTSTNFYLDSSAHLQLNFDASDWAPTLNGFLVQGSGASESSLTFNSTSTTKMVLNRKDSSFTVDNATFNVKGLATLAGSSATEPITFSVINSGVVNWNGGWNTGQYVGFSGVESGSKFVMNLDYDTAAKSFKIGKSDIVGQIVFTGQTATLADTYVDFWDTSTISGQTVANASDFARMRVRGGTLTVSGSEAGSVKAISIHFTTGSTLVVNSKNAFANREGGNATISFASTANAAGTLTLGADNAFGQFDLGNTDVTLNLNNNSKLTVASIIKDSNDASLTISGFKDGALQIDSLAEDFFTTNANSEKDGIYSTLNSDYVKTTDNTILVYFVDKTGAYKDYFGQVWSLSGADGIVVPEPAQWAAILGAIALGFVAYRRRK